MFQLDSLARSFLSFIILLGVLNALAPPATNSDNGNHHLDNSNKKMLHSRRLHQMAAAK